jgi:hypothetical protein
MEKVIEMAFILNRYLKNIFPALLVLCLGFTACTQGQQGANEGNGKVVGGGSEASPQGPSTPQGTAAAGGSEDVCEKPENVNDILCQWVAPEFKIEVGGKLVSTVKVEYDQEGWPTRLMTYDDQNNMIGVMAFFYNDFGVSKTLYLVTPDPVGSKNFTTDENTTYSYNSDGTLHSIHAVINIKGALDSSLDTTFQYFPQSSQMMSSEVWKDATNTTTRACNKTNQRDFTTGFIQSTDEKCGLPGMMGGSLETWSITTNTPDPNTGRLKSSNEKRQDCLVPGQPCGTTLVPTSITNYEVIFDAEERTLQYLGNTDGAVDLQTHAIITPVGQPPSSSEECDFTYDLKTQAKVAKKNPLGLYLMVAPMEGMNITFGDRDYFATFLCKFGNVTQMVMTPKWVRLWEVLPLGKPPGS